MQWRELEIAQIKTTLLKTSKESPMHIDFLSPLFQTANHTLFHFKHKKILLMSTQSRSRCRRTSEPVWWFLSRFNNFLKKTKKKLFVSIFFGFKRKIHDEIIFMVICNFIILFLNWKSSTAKESMLNFLFSILSVSSWKIEKYLQQ